MTKRQKQQKEFTASGAGTEQSEGPFADPARIKRLTSTFESPAPSPTWLSRCLSLMKFISLVLPILIISGLAIVLLKGAGRIRIELDAQVARVVDSLKLELDQRERRDAERFAAIESSMLREPAIAGLLKANTTELSDSLTGHHANLLAELKRQQTAQQPAQQPVQQTAQQTAQQDEARKKQVAETEFMNQIITTVDAAITSKLQSQIDRQPQATVATSSLSVFWIPANQKNAQDAQLAIINALQEEALKTARPFYVYVAANDQFAPVIELPIPVSFSRPQIGANAAVWYDRAKVEIQKKLGGDSVLIAATDHRPDVLVEFPLRTRCLVVEAESTGVDQEKIKENKDEWRKFIGLNSKRVQFILFNTAGTPTQLFDPLLNAVFEKSQPQENNTGIRP